MSKVIMLPAAESDVQEQEWGRLTWKASAALGNSDTMTVGICEIKPGCANPRHTHPNCVEILHVLQGTIIHTRGDEPEVEMTVGDTISVPPDIMHNARNVGSDMAILAISFSSAERRTVGE